MSLKDGWYCDRAPGASKVVYATPGNAATARPAGRIRGIGSGADGLGFTLPPAGDTIPAAGGSVSPIGGQTRAQIMFVFREAVGFDGSTMLSGLPLHADSTSFSLSGWFDFGVTGVVGFTPNPNQGAIYGVNNTSGAPLGTDLNASLQIAPGSALTSADGFGGFTGGGADGPFALLYDTYFGDGSLPGGPISYPGDGTTNAGWVHLMVAVKSNGTTYEATIWINDTEVVTAFDTAQLVANHSAISFNQADFTDSRSVAVAAKNNIGGTLHGGFSPAGALTLDTTPSGNGLYGAVAELWIAPGQFIDWSQQANREKFHISDTGIGANKVYAPCDLGNTGATPTGTAPSIYLRGGPSAFPANRAQAGTLTVTGALIPIDDPPG